jgi:putative hydrolase of the HAD superfamily
VVRPLLLDFGGVVLKTPFELKYLAEPTFGPMAWCGPFDVDTDPEWVRYQAGEITERTFWAERAATYGLDTHSFMRPFYEPPGDHLARPEMVALIHDHKARGGQVGMLTNDLQAFHGPEWMNGVSVIAEFDFIVDGSVTGVLKPDPRSFGFALAQLGNPNPADVVFVDDQRVNLGGAEAVGLTCVWFDPTNPLESIERINHELV